MSKGISSTGFENKTKQEIRNDLVSEMQSRFGTGYSLNNDTADGLFLDQIADKFKELWDLAESVYNNMIPSKTSGVTLSNIVTYNGIKRRSEVPTNTVLTIGGVAGTSHPAGIIVNSADDLNPYIIPDSFTIGPSGFEQVYAEATSLGTDVLDPNTLIKFESQVNNLVSVNNNFSTVLGSAVENDDDLKDRRELAISLPAICTLDAIESAISNIPYTFDVSVIENQEDTTDANNILPHSVLILVQPTPDLPGGAPTTNWRAEVHRAIYENKASGIETLQNISGSTRVTGSVTDSQGNTHSVAYEAPFVRTIYITVNTVQTTGFPSDGADQIEQAILDYMSGDLIRGRGFKIGDDIIQSELFTPAYNIPGHVITDIFIGISSNPTLSDDISIPFNHYGRADTFSITVNVT